MEALSDESVRNVNWSYFYNMEELKKRSDYNDMIKKKDITPQHIVNKRPQCLVTVIDKNQLDYFKKFPEALYCDGTFRVNKDSEVLINFLVKVSIFFHNLVKFDL